MRQVEARPEAADHVVIDTPELNLAAFTPQIRELTRLKVWRGLLAVALDWAVIICCFWLALRFQHWAVWVAAAIVIATRQHALLVLMHDASHYRLLRNRQWNDRLSNWLLAYPVFLTTASYRRHHLAHHRYLNTDDDPDLMRKKGIEDWVFPKRRLELASVLLRDLLGINTLTTLKLLVNISKRGRGTGKNEASAAKNSGTRTTGSSYGIVLYYTLCLAAILYSGMWLPVLLLWFVPALTLMAMILRLRIIAEHFGVPNRTQLDMSRNTLYSIPERILFAPHNVGYHLDHHLHTAIPFYNLPRFHRLLSSIPSYQQQSKRSDTFWGLSSSTVLKDITTVATPLSKRPAS
jgi:fatty acid desaturase